MQGNGSLLRAALEVTSTNSWAGFAFPAQSGRMVGANAIIVRPCTSCSSGIVLFISGTILLQKQSLLFHNE